jgi:hypothetical protein
MTNCTILIDNTDDKLTRREWYKYNKAIESAIYDARGYEGILHRGVTAMQEPSTEQLLALCLLLIAFPTMLLIMRLSGPINTQQMNRNAHGPTPKLPKPGGSRGIWVRNVDRAN